MPGTNLTREEAATRAALLSVTSYTVDLDLSGAPDKERTTFASTTTIEFGCSEPGADTFADLVGAEIHEITLNGEPVDPLGVRRQPDRADRAARAERADRARGLHLLAHG